jgi:hypothetical protein
VEKLPVRWRVKRSVGKSFSGFGDFFPWKKSFRPAVAAGVMAPGAWITLVYNLKHVLNLGALKDRGLAVIGREVKFSFGIE